MPFTPTCSDCCALRRDRDPRGIWPVRAPSPPLPRRFAGRENGRWTWRVNALVLCLSSLVPPDKNRKRNIPVQLEPMASRRLEFPNIICKGLEISGWFIPMFGSQIVQDYNTLDPAAWSSSRDAWRQRSCWAMTQYSNLKPGFLIPTIY